MTLIVAYSARLALVGVFGAWLWLATSSAAVPDDMPPSTSTKIAAVNLSIPHVPRGRQADDLGGEKAWLLAQNAQVDVLRAPGNEDTILVRFALSAPNGLEEEIAKTYDLELMDRSTLHALEMRIARYRVLNPARLEVVLERMQFDRRVASAQLNVRYAPHPPPALDIEVGVASKPKDSAPPAAQGDKGGASRAVASVAKTAPQPAPERSRLASASTRPLQRSGEVADLLAGGL